MATHNRTSRPFSDLHSCTMSSSSSSSSSVNSSLSRICCGVGVGGGKGLRVGGVWMVGAGPVRRHRLATAGGQPQRHGRRRTAPHLDRGRLREARDLPEHGGGAAAAARAAALLGMPLPLSTDRRGPPSRSRWEPGLRGFLPRRLPPVQLRYRRSILLLCHQQRSGRPAGSFECTVVRASRAQSRPRRRAGPNRL